MKMEKTREPIKERLIFNSYENWVNLYENELTIRDHTDTFWNTAENFGQIVKWINQKTKKENE
jgi:hypothetical protein